MMRSVEDEIVGELRRLGHRITEPRRAVIDVLAGTDEHLSADDVADRAQQRHDSVHRATVYRALETLGRLGLVTHTHLGGQAATYHLSPPSAAAVHAHAECTRCHRVFDLDITLLQPLAQRLAGDLGFILEPQHAALLGECAACNRRARASSTAR
jgi:Fur family transcriptional regulator, ferric uptake regulator